MTTGPLFRYFLTVSTCLPSFYANAVEQMMLISNDKMENNHGVCISLPPLVGGLRAAIVEAVSVMQVRSTNVSVPPGRHSLSIK